VSARKLALYEDATNAWGLIEADALQALARLPRSSIDAIVTDPPYGIAFHDEAWDGADIHAAVAGGAQLSIGEAFERWTTRWASECHRVLKPGGHMLAFSAPRMFHRLVCGVEDAGLEVRDQLLWLHAQGLPKSRRLPGGLGTTLKPAYEPVLLARKPFEGRVLDNLDAVGTGALNINAARIPREGGATGYWPAHVALSHAPACKNDSCAEDCPVPVLDASVSRLFFCAKATRREREAGCERLPERPVQVYTGKHHPPRIVRNIHPTVKPVELMRWLVRLITPPGGLVLDPFAGSGTTGIAAVQEDRLFLGVEREPEYVDIACARIAHWARETGNPS
jgi:site-specific DNA-methyltransferase (adenine-specific)